MKRLELEPTANVIADSIANDVAGRNDEIVAFVKLLCSIEGPYSVMLDAPWGDGKTFFVKTLIQLLSVLNDQIEPQDDFDLDKASSVMSQLEDLYPSFLPFYFNAWENDFADDPATAMLASMAASFDREGTTRQKNFRRLLTAAVDAGLLLTSVGTKISDIAEAWTGEDLISAYGNRSTLRSRIDQLAMQSNIEIANKLVIFIDELDRCRPDFAVRLLEQIKSLFQSENIIVVISTDSEQLARAVGGMYGKGFDSQHFLERFYDKRVILSHADGYKVATGQSFHKTAHVYDSLVSELMNRKPLTIRDCMRVEGLISAGRRYCDMEDSGSGAGLVAKCAIVPLLIFLQRDDISTFRRVTNGLDSDALYQYGKPFKAFLNILNKIIGLSLRMSKDSPDEVTDEQRADFMRDMCIVLFSAEQSTSDIWSAQERIGGSLWGISCSKDVFRRLEFPDVCYR